MGDNLSPLIEHHTLGNKLVALLEDSERERDNKVGPIAQSVIECFLTLISLYMLYYLLLPL